MPDKDSILAESDREARTLRETAYGFIREGDWRKGADCFDQALTVLLGGPENGAVAMGEQQGERREFIAAKLHRQDAIAAEELLRGESERVRAIMITGGMPTRGEYRRTVDRWQRVAAVLRDALAESVQKGEQQGARGEGEDG